MKKLLPLVFIAILLNCCKKDQSNKDEFNPPPGSPAANLQAKLVGTWESIISKTDYYEKSNALMHETVDATGVYYWVFGGAEPNIPSNLNAYVTTLDKAPEATGYTVSVENGVDYLIRYNQTPSDGDKSKLIFLDDANFQVIFTGVTPASYNIGSNLYVADHAEETMFFKKIK